jgi:hypothetical protein
MKTSIKVIIIVVICIIGLPFAVFYEQDTGNIGGIVLLSFFIFVIMAIRSNKSKKSPEHSVQKEVPLKKRKSIIEKKEELNLINWNEKFGILKNALESGVLTQLEYDNKKKKLHRKKRDVKSELRKLDEKIKIKEALKEQKKTRIDQKERLTQLLKEGLLTKHEYHQKMIAINESLNKLDL